LILTTQQRSAVKNKRSTVDIINRDWRTVFPNRSATEIISCRGTFFLVTNDQIRPIIQQVEGAMQRSIIFLSFTALGLFLGCAGSPNLGDSMKSHGQAAEQLGKQWEQGAKMLKQGEKLQVQSSKLTKQAEQKQVKAEDLITRGKELMKTSESSFDTQFPNSSAPNSNAPTAATSE
jgi:hypothetical protein